jgi:hypothetical protein
MNVCKCAQKRSAKKVGLDIGCQLLEKAGKMKKWQRPANAVAYISKGLLDWQKSAKFGQCLKKGRRRTPARRSATTAQRLAINKLAKVDKDDKAEQYRLTIVGTERSANIVV